MTAAEFIAQTWPSDAGLPVPLDGETLEQYRTRIWGSPDGVVPNAQRTGT